MHKSTWVKKHFNIKLKQKEENKDEIHSRQELLIVFSWSAASKLV
jgi:hypothetical protein